MQPERAKPIAGSYNEDCSERVDGLKDCFKPFIIPCSTVDVKVLKSTLMLRKCYKSSFLDKCTFLKIIGNKIFVEF